MWREPKQVPQAAEALGGLMGDVEVEMDETLDGLLQLAAGLRAVRSFLAESIRQVREEIRRSETGLEERWDRNLKERLEFLRQRLAQEEQGKLAELKSGTDDQVKKLRDSMAELGKATETALDRLGHQEEELRLASERLGRSLDGILTKLGRVEGLEAALNQLRDISAKREEAQQASEKERQALRSEMSAQFSALTAEVRAMGIRIGELQEGLVRTRTELARVQAAPPAAAPAAAPWTPQAPSAPTGAAAPPSPAKPAPPAQFGGLELDE